MKDPFEIAVAAFDLEADHRRNVENIFTALGGEGWVVVRWPGFPTGEGVKDVVNVLLHRAVGSAACATACTHVVHGAWTMLGVANVIGRADARSLPQSSEDVER